MSDEEVESFCRILTQEVPEIQSRVVEIKAVARMARLRAKVALQSHDPAVDCVGACVGERGIRIRKIVEQLDGERIDLVRWDESPEKLVANALQPAEIQSILIDRTRRLATVLVHEDQLSVAVGRRGLNQKLASELCGYEIDIMTPEQFGQKSSEAP